jgi:hypothetical protein
LVEVELEAGVSGTPFYGEMIFSEVDVAVF